MTSAVMIDRRSVCVKEYEIKFNQSFTAQRTLWSTVSVSVTECHTVKLKNHEVSASRYAECENLTTSNIALTRKDKHVWEKHSNNLHDHISGRTEFVAWCCCHANEHTVFLWRKTWSCLRTYDLNLQLYLLNMIMVVLNVHYSKPSLHSTYLTYVLIVLMHSEHLRCWNLKSCSLSA